MKSKSLETLMARESGLYSDMVTRFQKLRDFGLISKGRGRNAEFLTPDEVVAGMFAVVAERPGFAAVTAIGLLKMMPVGLPEDAFAGAANLSQAVVRALQSEALREALIEIRLGDSDPRAHMSTTAVITYKSGDQTLSTYYIGSTAVSQFAKGMEKTFNRGAMGEFSVSRDTVITRRLVQKVARAMQESAQQQRLEEQMEKSFSEIAERSRGEA